jgi:hypothetical protein
MPITELGRVRRKTQNNQQTEYKVRQYNNNNCFGGGGGDFELTFVAAQMQQVPCNVITYSYYTANISGEIIFALCNNRGNVDCYFLGRSLLYFT